METVQPNIRTLKRLMTAPLDKPGILEIRLGEFLKGVFDAGRIMGFSKGYDEGFANGQKKLTERM